ncbi:MAG TPA: hypothetical protein VMB47_05595 [Candidatus Aquilonibacter sp.]|nr:hypothetical protein [Candidatus Aquilonibacter sp.]
MTGIVIAFGFLALIAVGAYAQFVSKPAGKRVRRRKRPRPQEKKPLHVGLASTGVRNDAPRHLQFQFDDGGRKAAGYKGRTGDCVVRSIAIATALPYQEIYDKVNHLAFRERTGKRKRGKSNARTGVYKGTTHKLLESLGWHWTPTMEIGSGCKVHMRADELPQGRLIVSVSGHLTAVIDGVIHDTHDPSRRGTRCVYGYWQRGEN